MAHEWYYARAGQRFGPLPDTELRRLAAAGQVYATDLVWSEGMADWQLAGLVPGVFPVGPGVPPPLAAARPDTGQRLAAGVCAILLGGLGIHKFLLGLTWPGLVMLMVSLLTCGLGAFVMHAIGVVEGILYLTKSDEAFYQTYVVGRRGWF